MVKRQRAKRQKRPAKKIAETVSKAKRRRQKYWTEEEK